MSGSKGRGAMRVGLWLSLAGCVGPWEGVDDTDGGGGIDIATAAAGFVYVGPVTDHGWSKTHDDGRLAVEAEFGIPTYYEPSVIPADAGAAITRLRDQGSNIIFTTSFDYVSATQQAATTNEDAYFLSCSGNVWGPNLTSYMGRMYQAMYLAGMTAGRMTSTNHVGIVMSVPIPETVRHTNAFALGVRKTNPTAVVEVKWVNNWFDGDLEPQLTQELVANGSDIIVTGTDTTIPLETADGMMAPLPGGGTTPVYSIGYDNADSCDFAPDSCLTSAYWNWGPMYVELVGQILDGSIEPSDIRWDQMNSTPERSAVALAPFSPLVPGTVSLEVGSELATLTQADGRQLPFRGPISDSTGELRVSAGDEMDDDALNRMCWFVDGVIEVTVDGEEPAIVPAGCGGDQ